jgi:hypothetical protein
LASLWPKPALEFPDELWPTAELARIEEHPTEWVVVVEHYFRDDAHGGVGCVLIDQAGIERTLTDDTWIGRDIGRTGTVTSWSSSGPGDESFEDGLTCTDRDVVVQFFCQVREHHGLVLPSVEISLPFLWYWDAHQDGDNWVYLNEAGRDQDLIRTVVQEDSQRVKVRAFELRQYLAVRNLALVVQHDVVLKSEQDDFERADDELRSEWCYFTWHAMADRPLPGSRPGFSRLLGQYVVKPLRGPRLPAWQARSRTPDYPEFQHDVDPQTGQAIRHTCDPDQLGTYYDPPNTPPRPHYLTPVYFNREVLGRYTSEPSRYIVSATRLSCLNLWGVAISTNTAGLVEVYLGDLGRDLPADEWPHWLGHNVAPAGSMAEDRFRRDFLNQPTASHDPVGDLRRARSETQELARGLLSSGLWKELQGRQRREFDNLHSPTSRDPSALDSALLTLTKGLIDAIEPTALRTYLGKEASQDMRTLQMLEVLAERLGGDPAIIKPLRDVQQLRSAGGVAHLAGSDVDKVLARTGIAGLAPHQAFESLCGRLTDALSQLGALLAQTRGL